MLIKQFEASIYNGLLVCYPWARHFAFLRLVTDWWGEAAFSQTRPASEINPQHFYLQLFIPVLQMESHFPRGMRTSAHASH